MKVIWVFCLVLVVLLWGGGARAGVLGDRISSFPNWDSKPPIAVAKGDLVYPDWMAGSWNVASTLIDLAAPLAPNIVTPGFEKNRQYLQQPVLFKVRFQPEKFIGLISTYTSKKAPKIVADRNFNGLNIAKAYLGNGGVLSVKVDPNNPNRQITILKGDRQLISIVTSRGTETPNPREFVSTEISQQVFRGETDIYLNEVETTTAYRVIGSGENGSSGSKKIVADQVTAIYLSPQDPDYFAAGGHPVALYRYRLELSPGESS
ncbi:MULTISPECIES: DUF6816 family protein [unclassified Microcoleus]|uniref:DUF6816 family protein n=1 Tax=unclassified Microcoleus TaxID=2642155 RepID=UPI001DC2F9F9|nr:MULTISPECIES: hypothetical protein [unclassified Microcoleus]MCC3442283.1 hypothetical protein [Microcoleus sp. PH2017_03_ELD_O_A]MCC3502970.1 hypothetical protein [Microcoleus sp. PH2017_19_SFW_U_A]TAE66975.1 MAG: hypothetical protein EAZ86_18615 [Oscillatoriales cyanobacterium]MCC3455536.1 hypothetical protein [Microcoleus sp. PH2017_08_TRC_O_A]MCC3522727.1 hypothetical protein [Microcoleus sp. PH2017_20_SFW_D_A]